MHMYSSYFLINIFIWVFFFLLILIRMVCRAHICYFLFITISFFNCITCLVSIKRSITYWLVYRVIVVILILLVSIATTKWSHFQSWIWAKLGLTTKIKMIFKRTIWFCILKRKTLRNLVNNHSYIIFEIYEIGDNFAKK